MQKNAKVESVPLCLKLYNYGKKAFCLITIFWFGLLHGNHPWHLENQTEASEYLYNPLVEFSVWQNLKQYFLPINHPIKARLDRLFKTNRVTQSKTTFEKAGFKKIKMRKPTNIVIGRHPQFKDYIFKVYLDSQPNVCEWENWIKRIEGAKSIEDCIIHNHLSYVTVPKKWIYPLPEEPSPSLDPKYHRKNFILIVENMKILNKKHNLKAFKTKMSPEILDELFIVLNEEGLIDSVYPDNIPFTKKGKIAFIDTEHHHLGPIHYEKLNSFLSPGMQKYWSLITEKELTERISN